MIDYNTGTQIIYAYTRSNIFVWSDAWDANNVINHENLWLAAMGMLDTLIIKGVEAKIRCMR